MQQRYILYTIILIILLCAGCGNKKQEQGEIKTKHPLEKYQKLSDAELNQPDSTGKTLLHRAVIKNDTDLADYLVQRGVPIDQKDGNGFTALHYAVLKRNMSSVRLLLKHNADLHLVTIEQNTPLHLAVNNNDIAMAELLYFKGAYSDARNKNSEGYSPLTLAIGKRYYVLAELLYWPLHYVIKRNSQEYLDYLLQINPEYIGKKDQKGMTPLHIAHLYENSDLVEKLFAAGADQNAKDHFGRKPEDYQYNKFTSMIERDVLDPSLRQKVDDKMFDFLIHYDWMTVGLIQEGNIAYLRSYGKKNMIHEDAVYASVSKPVTSIIFMQLLKKGLIRDLNDNIFDYSTKYTRHVMPAQFTDDSLTFKHLLTHRSGIPHINKPLWQNGKLNLQFSPGTKKEYTTNGFGVLGEVMEEITGQSYSDLVKEYIGKPVNAGSFWAEKNFRAPAARVHSTPEDFARFAQGVINHTYINEDDFYGILMKNYQGGTLGWGGSGWDTEDFTIGHAGSNGKSRAYILLKPRKKIGVVLMGQCKNKNEIWFIHLGPILMDILEKKGYF